jgi:hypothetical protein
MQEETAPGTGTTPAPEAEPAEQTTTEEGVLPGDQGEDPADDDDS